MKDKEKLATLAHLLKLLNLGEHPTLRDTGIPVETLRALKAEQLITFGEQVSDPGADELDRFVVLDIKLSAFSWMLQQEEKAKQAALHPSLFGRIASALGKRLWDLLWDVLKVGVGIGVGWFLANHYGIH